jgi:hypothetical protein
VGFRLPGALAPGHTGTFQRPPEEPQAASVRPVAAVRGS